jgi:hypothetical protein
MEGVVPRESRSLLKRIRSGRAVHKVTRRCWFEDLPNLTPVARLWRWRTQTYQDVTNFDDCGFGKYCYISFDPTSPLPSNRSHNLLVRGSNPCGSTNVISDLRFVRFFYHTPPTYDGGKMARFFEERDSRVMRPGPSLVADGSALVTLQLESRSTESLQAVRGIALGRERISTGLPTHMNKYRCTQRLIAVRVRPRHVQPGGHSGFASFLFHRCQSAANSLTFSGCAAARFFVSPISSARL